MYCNGSMTHYSALRTINDFKNCLWFVHWKGSIYSSVCQFKELLMITWTNLPKFPPIGGLTVILIEIDIPLWLLDLSGDTACITAQRCFHYEVKNRIITYFYPNYEPCSRFLEIWVKNKWLLSKVAHGIIHLVRTQKFPKN